jgi:hypothetical protein
MAEYCYVENNEILEYHSELPSSWKNISGLNLSKSNTDFLLSIGWYSVEKQDILYDEKTHKITGYNYTIESNKVVETPIIELYTPQEILDKNANEKYIFYQYLRDMRDNLLKDSDWTQCVDIQLKNSTEWIDAWKNYRQQLRDLPQYYVQVETYDINSILWPIKPKS